MITLGVLDDATTKVLLACVVDVRPTTSTVVQRTGLSRTRVHRILHHLRRQGLVGFESKHQGTLRATVAVVPITGGNLAD